MGYVKMGVYEEDWILADYGVYDSVEEAEQDFENFDKPKGRTKLIEVEE